MGRVTDTVKHLIIINAVFFVTSQTFGDQAYRLLSLWFPENENFRVWQIFTHMFMHHPTFYLHILFNMFGLWMFGTPLEQMWGRNKFLFFYFSAGIGAVLLPLVMDYYQYNDSLNQLVAAGFNESDINSLLNTSRYDTRWDDVIGVENVKKFNRIFTKNSLGASGAVMGLLAAYGVSFPNAKLMLIFLPVPISAKYFIPLILAYEIISGYTGGNSMFGVNVAHFAHVGGALTGLLIAWYWKKNQFKRWN